MVNTAVTNEELKIRLALGRHLKDLEVRRSLELQRRLPYTYSTSRHPTLGIEAMVRVGAFKVTFYPRNEDEALEMLADGMEKAVQEGLKQKAAGKTVNLVDMKLTRPAKGPPDDGRGKGPKLRKRKEREQDLDGGTEAGVG